MLLTSMRQMISVGFPGLHVDGKGVRNFQVGDPKSREYIYIYPSTFRLRSQVFRTGPKGSPKHPQNGSARLVSVFVHRRSANAGQPLAARVPFQETGKRQVTVMGCRALCKEPREECLSSADPPFSRQPDSFNPPHLGPDELLLGDLGYPRTSDTGHRRTCWPSANRIRVVRLLLSFNVDSLPHSASR